jgi:hypothetical protein
MNRAIIEFLQGFGPGFLFSTRRRPGAATQVFPTEDVPCDEEVQQAADTYINENALSDAPARSVSCVDLAPRQS